MNSAYLRKQKEGNAFHLFAVIVLNGAVVLSCKKAQSGPGDDIERVIVLEEYDHGVLENDHYSAHEFAILNDSGTTWEVIETRTECGCSEITRCAEEIPPGETLRFVVRLNTARTKPGILRESAFVTISPGPRTVVATSLATIIPAPSIDPSFMAIHVGYAQDKFAATCRLYTYGRFEEESIAWASNDPISVTALPDSSLEGALSVQLEGLLEGLSTSYEYEVQCVLESSAAASKKLPLRIHVVRDPPFLVTPRSIVFCSSLGFRAQVVVSMEDDSAFEDLAISCNPLDSIDITVIDAKGRLLLSRGKAPADRAEVTLTSPSGYRESIPVEIR